MGNFKQMLVWQKAYALSEKIKLLSEAMQEDEGFGLMDQVQETAMKVVKKIEEGSKRERKEELKPFLEKALKFTYELETELVVLGDLEMVMPGVVEPVLNEVLDLQRLLKQQISS